MSPTRIKQVEYTFTPYDLGWLVGWIEGEGTFYCNITEKTEVRKEYRRPIVRAVSTDLETCKHAFDIAQGTVNGPYQGKGNRQAYYTWSVSGKLAAPMLMRILYPHMSARRQRQITKTLEYLQNGRI